MSRVFLLLLLILYLKGPVFASESCETAKHVPLTSAKSIPLPPSRLESIRPQMTLRDIIERLGPAARDVGSGLIILEWNSTDGRVFRVGGSALCRAPLYARFELGARFESGRTMAISNPKMSAYLFLRELVRDSYFPPHLVKKGQAILAQLCVDIEKQKPKSLEQLYALTHRATEQFNELGHEFEDAGSEIETVARENIGDDMETIAKAYGFDADTEELIAPREW